MCRTLPIVAILLCLMLARPAFAAAGTQADYTFVGPGSKYWTDFYIEYGFHPKQWTVAERSTFNGILEKIRIKQPAFFKRAVQACRPLGLIRRNMRAADNENPNDRAVCMLTGVATIEVSDAFFRADHAFQYYSVMHELGHLLDTACVFSTSPQFLSVALPLMTKARKSYGHDAFAPMSDELDTFGESLAKKTGLPSLDAAAGPGECFAEVVAHYFVEGPKSVSLPFRKYVEEHVLKEDARTERARKLYVEQELATNDGKYDAALVSLNELLRDHPDMLDVHASRARIWGFKHDFEMMQIEANQELALLNRRAVPKYHWTWSRAAELLDDAREHYGFETVSRRLTAAHARR